MIIGSRDRIVSLVIEARARRSETSRKALRPPPSVLFSGYRAYFPGVTGPGSNPVAARSKVWVYGRSLTRIAGSNPAGGMDVCLLRVLCVVR